RSGGCAVRPRLRGGGRAARRRAAHHRGGRGTHCRGFPPAAPRWTLMDERDLDRLADLIAREILRSQDTGPTPARPYGFTEREHVPAPVWNEPVQGVAPPPDAVLAARAAASHRGLGAAAPGATRRTRPAALDPRAREIDRKSTRLNSSH